MIVFLKQLMLKLVNGLVNGGNKMSEYTQYLKWIYRRNLLKARGEEMNRGIIGKLNRKIRNYEKENM